MDTAVLMFGAALIGAIKHIELGLREHVFVAHVALRRRRDARGRQNGWLRKCRRRICRESALRASSPLCRHWSRGDGGDWHTKPSTHPLPSKAGIRISRFVAGALLHPWSAAGVQAAPVSHPREPGHPRAQTQAWGFRCAVCSIDCLPNATATTLRQSPASVSRHSICRSRFCVEDRIHSQAIYA